MTTLAADAKWWDALPDDFHRRREGTELDAIHPLKVHGSAAIDRAMRTALSAVMSAAVAPTWLLPRRFRRDMERLQFHAALAQHANSERSFPRPERASVEEMKPRRFGYRPWRIPYRLLRSDTTFRPLHPDLGESYGKHLRNATAYAQHWYHHDGPRPTLIMVHGFIADPYWFNAQMFSLGWFHRHGYDVLLYTLPFHGYRGGQWDWFSGYGLFARGLAHFNEALAHAVHDLRSFMDHLEERGVKQIGITGLSLGGYTSALMAGVDDRLSFCIPNSPVVSPVDLMREWQPTGVMMAAFLKLYGLTLRDLRAGLAVHGPLTYAPKIDPRRILIIGGAGDRFTPPKHVRLLHGHWPGSTLHWFPGNHLLHLRQGEYLRVMKHFMDRCVAAPVKLETDVA
jgi:pimeloyl-ACP methyl ester carboxylesterase